MLPISIFQRWLLVTVAVLATNSGGAELWRPSGLLVTHAASPCTGNLYTSTCGKNYHTNKWEVLNYDNNSLLSRNSTVYFPSNPSRNGGYITRKFSASAAPGRAKTTITRKLPLRHGRLELTLIVSTALFIAWGSWTGQGMMLLREMRTCELAPLDSTVAVGQSVPAGCWGSVVIGDVSARMRIRSSAPIWGCVETSGHIVTLFWCSVTGIILVLQPHRVHKILIGIFSVGC